jgi:IS605 OrfB family transposase
MADRKPNNRLLARERKAAAGLSTRVLRLRLKDKHAKALRALATEVNLVWNYVNDLSYKVLRREGRFLSVVDLHKFTVGATKEGLNLHSQTVQAINEEFVTRRKQFKKAKLRWRVSNPERANYSLGWIPFKKPAIAYRNGQVFLAGMPLSLWDSYGLADYTLGAGSISEDARGRWYLNVTVQVQRKTKVAACSQVAQSALGIDLGLKELIATSDCTKVPADRFYRDLEPRLASAQRAGKKGLTRALHAKIRNRRHDALHKLSTGLVKTRQAIFVGDVSSSGLTQTTMAKSVLDAGWAAFKTMLQYKSDDAGVWFQVVDERYTTQDCSCCGTRAGPKGRQGLSVRSWTCSNCGSVLDRDVNAAINIRNRGLVWLEQQFSAADSGSLEQRPAVNKAFGAAMHQAAVGHDRPVVGIPFL